MKRSLPLTSEIPLYEGNLDEDLLTVSRNREADRITGGLSITTKMPCPSWGIPASRCKIGSVLAQKEGTVCSECYALGGRYRFTNVQNKLEERYQGLFNPLWTPAMVFLIRYFADRYFRWFDSGDLQDANHLKNITTVAEATPDIRHWLPTREAEIVRSVGEFPKNLTVRLSAHHLDGKPPNWRTTSTVVTGETPDGSFPCPSQDQGGECGNCRACWSKRIKNVAYQLH